MVTIGILKIPHKIRFPMVIFIAVLVLVAGKAEVLSPFLYQPLEHNYTHQQSALTIVDNEHPGL